MMNEGCLYTASDPSDPLDRSSLLTFKDPGCGPLFGVDHTTTFVCLICEKTRMPIREAGGDWRLVPQTKVTPFDDMVGMHPDVCYFCVRENAAWKDGVPCFHCIGHGQFINTRIFIGCGCSPIVPKKPTIDAKFKTFVLKKMNRFTIVERLVLLWLAKQKDLIFSRLPKVLLRHMCEVGLPLPCPQ